MNYNITYEHKDNDDGVMVAECAWHALALNVSLRCETPHMIAIVDKDGPPPDSMEREIVRRMAMNDSQRAANPLVFYCISGLPGDSAICYASDGIGEFKPFAEAREPEEAETPHE